MNRREKMLQRRAKMRSTGKKEGKIKGRKITVEIFSLCNSITEYLKCQCARLWGIPLRFYFWAVWTSQKVETRVHCSYA